MPVEITLGADPASGEGGVTVPVYAQRHAYLTNRVGAFINGLMEAGQGLDLSTIAALPSEQSWKLLTALIPNLSKRMSEWEFRGFASADAFARGDFDPAADMTSPSVPEIREAIRVAGEVNGLDVLLHLKRAFGLVDPTVLRAIVSEKLMEAIDSVSTTSPSSPSGIGESTSTSSGTSVPTSTENVDSLSPV